MWYTGLRVVIVIMTIAQERAKEPLSMTELAYTLIALAALVLVPLWALSALAGRKLWHCTECSFECYDEHEILGHREYHRTKHSFYQD
jgi:hypothetical protein